MSDTKNNVELNDVVEQDAELSKVEELVGQIAKSLESKSEDAETLEVIAKGADAIVAQNKALVEDLQKSISDLTDKVVSLTERLDAVTAENAEVKKSLAEISEQPVAKAVVNAEVAPAPLDAQPEPVVITKSMVAQKAIRELSDSSDIARKGELSKAITRLDSGFAPAEIAQSLGYTF